MEKGFGSLGRGYSIVSVLTVHPNSVDLSGPRLQKHLTARQGVGLLCPTLTQFSKFNAPGLCVAK